jgi:hypothetical protein
MQADHSLTRRDPRIDRLRSPSSNLKDAADALADGFTKAKLVGMHSVIAGGIVTRAGEWIPVHAIGFNNDVKESGGLLPYFDPPTDAVLVLVGMRPVATVLREGTEQGKGRATALINWMVDPPKGIRPLHFRSFLADRRQLDLFGGCCLIP